MGLDGGDPGRDPCSAREDQHVDGHQDKPRGKLGGLLGSYCSMYAAVLSGCFWVEVAHFKEDPHERSKVVSREITLLCGTKVLLSWKPQHTGIATGRSA